MWPLNYLLDWSLDERILNKLKGTGFDILRDFNQHLCLNLPLINALIRRYDADTRSFILGSAENPFSVAFGLEDVLYLTGLPIDGKPVTGIDPKDTERVCQRYLGKHEGYGYGKGYISLKWLKENFMTIGDDENLSEQVLAYHVRAYVMYVIGCTFVAKERSTVSDVFLPLLENVEDIGSYAWGAALLANIHDSMGIPTRYSVGLYFPLMIFAYIRFPGLLSTVELDLDGATVNAFPLVVSWSHALGLVMRQQFKNHDEEKLETFFNSLKEEEGTGEGKVKWQPYAELSNNFLPQHLREQVVLSKSRTILICFEMAVYHRPDKCQRQLGLAGHVLKDKLIEINTLQGRCGRKGNNGKDWSKKEKYVDYISEWDKRFDLLIDRDAIAEPDQAEASDHTDRDENIAPIVVEAGSVNDVASLEETVVVLDNQDPERDSLFEEEVRRAEASLIAELRKENEKLKEEARGADAMLITELRKENEKLQEETRRAETSLIAELRKENDKLKEEIELYSKNIPDHVNRILRIEESLADLLGNNVLNSRGDNVDVELVDHQSPGDTTSSRVRNSAEIRRCDPQIEAISVKKQRVSSSNTSEGVVDRAKPPRIIYIDSDSDSDSDSDMSITDSFMDALVGRSKNG